MPATGHTLTAVSASGSTWSRSAKVWIGYSLTGFTEVNAKRCHLKSISKAQAIAGFFQSLVGRREKLVHFHPEHAFGLVERAAPSPAPQRRFELLQTCMVTHEDFRFARPAIGFETFAKGELIASQGADEIRAPCDDCTILMPTREPIIGREAVYLSRAMG